ncbi:MAG: 1-(5-phosphoribosyl)-5-[(5-phosphoribosylamino)methylideneamino]imidazole-4-carboxamide isomerase [bacterium]
MLVIPAIDLRAGHCVRLTQGRRESTKVYDGEPVDIARGYEAAGAQMLHIVDLDGAFSEPNSSNRKTLREIVRSIKIPVQFGGGMRTVEQVDEVIDFGIARVVIGTLAVESPETLSKLLSIFGGEKIAVGIDAKGGTVVTRGWEKEAAVSAVSFALHLASVGVERVIYTDVSRDGMLTGVNVEATCEIARVTGLKVTASGGVSSLEDLRNLTAVSDCMIDSVIVGKALYEGCFTIQEALLVTDSQ